MNLLIVFTLLLSLNTVSSYISSNPYQNYNSYNYQQNYLLGEPYYYNNDYYNQMHYTGYRSNPGMLANGQPEYGNQAWGNSLASFSLFCMNCPRG